MRQHIALKSKRSAKLEQKRLVKADTYNDHSEPLGDLLYKLLTICSKMGTWPTPAVAGRISMELRVDQVTASCHSAVQDIEFGGLEMADVLVVTSKVKKFIKENGDCNTSSETIAVLSEAVRKLCQKGVENAKADGRKTVMARDIVLDHI